MDEEENNEIWEGIDEYLEQLIDVWFMYMRNYNISMDRTANTVDRRDAAIVCELCMKKRYRMIKAIDDHFHERL
jgi:hypothetical protein